jgi:hypothetical protein
VTYRQIRRSHDPNLGAVSEDSRFEDDPEVDSDDWQNQAPMMMMSYCIMLVVLPVIHCMLLS